MSMAVLKSKRQLYLPVQSSACKRVCTGKCNSASNKYSTQRDVASTEFDVAFITPYITDLVFQTPAWPLNCVNNQPENSSTVGSSRTLYWSTTEFSNCSQLTSQGTYFKNFPSWNWQEGIYRPAQSLAAQYFGPERTRAAGVFKVCHLDGPLSQRQPDQSRSARNTGSVWETSSSGSLPYRQAIEFPSGTARKIHPNSKGTFAVDPGSWFFKAAQLNSLPVYLASDERSCYPQQLNQNADNQNSSNFETLSCEAISIAFPSLENECSFAALDLSRRILAKTISVQLKTRIFRTKNELLSLILACVSLAVKLFDKRDLAIKLIRCLRERADISKLVLRQAELQVLCCVDWDPLCLIPQ
mmetsp:Transcript_18230/g.43623  ORF Transcript_18230/g.43623 Transcript_18230/m.43623 type:complete len:357 (+) Transcript_18230:449-1519(+)